MALEREESYPGVEAETSFEIQLYIYDMSKGMAKSFSSLFLGKELPGIWHTGVVAYGREYFFGFNGIESCNPGETILGEPDQILQLGRTELPYSLFLEYIFSLGDSTFTPGSYDLFDHNCNNFSNEVALLLTGKPVPREILDVPLEVLSTPFGQTIKGFLGSFDIRPQGTGVNFSSTTPRVAQILPRQSVPNFEDQLSSSNAQVQQSSSNGKETKTTRVEQVSTTTSTQPEMEGTVETKKKASSKKALKEEVNGETNGTVNGVKENGENGENSENRVTQNGDNEEDEQPKQPKPERRTYKYKDPPVVFNDVDGEKAMKKLTELVYDLLNPEEQTELKEWTEYLSTDSGAWILGNEHLDLFYHLLSGEDGKFAPNVPLLAIQALQAAALKEDFVLVLHQDRKDHRLMTYFNRIETLTLAEQEEIAKLLCNLCSQPSSFDWLMYITEWCEADGQQANNCRVTTRAAVHTVLNEKLTTLQKTGVFLISNLALKELFEDTATELATAILQFIHGDLPEDQALICLTALLRFMNISVNDVPALTKMLGPDLSKFKGKSEDIDKVIEQIDSKVASALGSSRGN